jgi:hypothetical protein
MVWIHAVRSSLRPVMAACQAADRLGDQMTQARRARERARVLRCFPDGRPDAASRVRRPKRPRVSAAHRHDYFVASSRVAAGTKWRREERQRRRCAGERGATMRRDGGGVARCISCRWCLQRESAGPRRLEIARCRGSCLSGGLNRGGQLSTAISVKTRSVP